MTGLYISKVTKAGQVSIPKELRAEMKLKEAEYVSMEPRQGAILMRKIKPFSDYLESFRAEAKRKGITGKDVQTAIDEVGRSLVKERYGL